MDRAHTCINAPLMQEDTEVKGGFENHPQEVIKKTAEETPQRLAADANVAQSYQWPVPVCPSPLDAGGHFPEL